MGQTPAPHTSSQLWREARAIANAEELRQALRLRFEVFAPVGIISAAYLSPATRLELDEFDRFSLPFGCFIGTTDHLAGTVRIITRQLQEHASRLIGTILREINDANLRRAYEAPLPGNLLLSECWPYGDLPSEITSDPATCGELSRLAVHPSHRKRGLARLLINQAIGAARQLGLKTLCLACGTWHVTLHERFGFRVIPGSRTASFRGQPSAAMYMRLAE
ncbi:MAG: GNAT family N-acetyltransferase [Phycisphaerae bacterium]|nr:GNAT family N-acetyltransferase [Phycisphaerae bacterium]